MAKVSYNFIDLFSGCGGFSAGLEMSGHKCLLGVDFAEAAVKSFARNHPKAHALHMDVHKLTKTKLEKLIDFEQVDMVVGGPPCQGFSTVGKGNAEDQRNSLFQQFVRIVRVTQPKIVLFENVTGMLAKKNELVVKRIFASFEKLGYHMDAKVLSADDYGVPSRRKRTIIMGVKAGTPQFPQVKFGGKKPYVTIKDAFDNLADRKGVIHNHEIDKATISKKLDAQRLSHIPAGCGIRYERDELAYLPKKLRFDVDWKTISEGRFRQTRLQRLPWDIPGPTMLTSRTMYYHPEENRYLTPREAASCQSFPNDFVFEGSLTAQFRQIGNAVPPLMAKHIGAQIKKIEFSDKIVKSNTFKNKAKFTSDAFTYKTSKFA
jgi:DNA (cytosine-5)-methyltransferase 1